VKSSYDCAALLYENVSSERPWLMSHADRAALLQVLRIARPECAIEIGTANGGCLEQIRRHATMTYSIDLEPAVRERLAPDMPNVEFLTGDSKQLIGVALQRCAERGQALGFVLIDGDHSAACVEADIHAVLQHRPSRPVWVLMHDASNPECRAGIAGARWGDNPHVHMVDLDFVTGAIGEDPRFKGEIWGGFAIALLRPEPRTGALEVASSAAANYRALYESSSHSQTWRNHWRHWWLVKKKGLARRLGKTSTGA
jgi:hypothetical protein